jgi:hypothetical protein
VKPDLDALKNEQSVQPRYNDNPTHLLAKPGQSDSAGLAVDRNKRQVKLAVIVQPIGPELEVLSVVASHVTRGRTLSIAAQPNSPSPSRSRELARRVLVGHRAKSGHAARKGGLRRGETPLSSPWWSNGEFKCTKGRAGSIYNVEATVTFDNKDKSNEANNRAKRIINNHANDE